MNQKDSPIMPDIAVKKIVVEKAATGSFKKKSASKKRQGKSGGSAGQTPAEFKSEAIKILAGCDASTLQDASAACFTGLIKAYKGGEVIDSDDDMGLLIQRLKNEKGYVKGDYTFG